ncbi:MAG: hypothetical protein QOI08_2262, partial [Actinomycetota bacterium]|nr:hypothetical protein [Actinomycetota bacterium]
MRQPQDLRGALGELLNDGEVNGVVRPEIAA